MFNQSGIDVYLSHPGQPIFLLNSNGLWDFEIQVQMLYLYSLHIISFSKTGWLCNPKQDSCAILSVDQTRLQARDCRQQFCFLLRKDNAHAFELNPRDPWACKQSNTLCWQNYMFHWADLTWNQKILHNGAVGDAMRVAHVARAACHEVDVCPLKQTTAYPRAPKLAVIGARGWKLLKCCAIDNQINLFALLLFS